MAINEFKFPRKAMTMNTSTRRTDLSSSFSSKKEERGRRVRDEKRDIGTCMYFRRFPK